MESVMAAQQVIASSECKLSPRQHMLSFAPAAAEGLDFLGANLFLLW